MYAEAVLKNHLPSEQSAMLTPAFSSSSPALLPKKLVSGWVFPVAASATVVRYLHLQLCLCHCGFHSLFIPTAACLPACRCPPALPRSCLSLVTPAPGSCCHHPKGFWCRWLPGAAVVGMGKQEVLQQVSSRQNWAEECGLSKEPSMISAGGSCSRQQFRYNSQWYPLPWLLTSYDLRC